MHFLLRNGKESLPLESDEMHSTVEPRYNEVLGTMKITLLYQVSHYIRVKKQKQRVNKHMLFDG